MWTFGGVRIFVQSLPENLRQIIARLQPVSGGTVYQLFGYESPIYKIKAYVVGIEDKNILDDYYSDGLPHTLSGYWGTVGSFYVSAMTIDPMPAVKQSLRQDLDCEAQVYNLDMELFEDV